MISNKILKVLMIGPGRNVMGGISTVVNNYYQLGLDKKIKLKYISTMEDGNKIKKIFVAGHAWIDFLKSINRFDIVHIHMAAQSSFFRKSLFVWKARKSKKKIIIHQHSADFDEFFLKQSTDKMRKYIRKIFSMADCVIVLSEEWYSFFKKNVCDGKKIVVLYNGVIIPAYKKEEYQNMNVLFLGRLGKRKGSYDLVEALPNVLKEVPEAQFFLGGDGEINKTQQIIEQKGLQNSIKLLGWLQDDQKVEYLKKCSVFILPSYQEGMPMSVLEAMSYGLAVLSTNAGGIPQIIDNGVDGVRIEAGEVDQIEKSLIELLRSIEWKKKLAQAGYEKVKKEFNAEVLTNELVQIYSEINEGENDSN